MQTYTGGQFFPIDPRAEEIRIEDISAALSKQCRYGGHCTKFYSVAEHCVLLAEVAPTPYRLAMLLHDASEAYLVDIPRPIKGYLGNYKEIELRLMDVIAEKFCFTWPLPAEVMQLDHRILLDELSQNMAKAPVVWADESGLDASHKPLGISLKFWTPAEASYQFTCAFYRHGGKA